jgi:transposase-like protein
MDKRRKYTSEFKVKLVLEVLHEAQTLGEIAAKYEINPNQLANWKREFLEKAPKVFDETKNDRERRRIEREAADKEARMLKTIGQLTMERDFLQAVRAKDTERGNL